MNCAPIASATFASQAIAASTPTAVAWAVPDPTSYQDDLGLDVWSTTTRVTIGSNVDRGSGVFLVLAEIDFANQATAPAYYSGILQHKNSAGTVQNYIEDQDRSPTSAASTTSKVLPMLVGGVASGDYFEVVATHNSALSRNVSGKLFIYRLPGGTLLSKFTLASQSITTGAGVTVTFSGATVNQDAIGLFQPPAFPDLKFVQGGSYMVVAYCEWDSNATGRRLLSIAQNTSGATTDARSVYERTTASGVVTRQTGQCLFDRTTAGDLLRVSVQQNSGGTRTLTGSVWVAKLPISLFPTFVSTQPAQSTVASNTEILGTVAVVSVATPIDRQGSVEVAQQTRLTFDIPGVYLVSTDFCSLDTNTTGYRRTVIYHKSSGGTAKNTWTVACRAPGTNTYEVRQGPSALLANVVAGDYLEFGYLQDSGTASLSFEMVRCAVTRLGPAT